MKRVYIYINDRDETSWRSWFWKFRVIGFDILIEYKLHKMHMMTIGAKKTGFRVSSVSFDSQH